MKILGIDEAGRGPLIGPMVMAGVVATLEQEKRLKNIQVRDSKMIAPAVREEMFDRIKSIVTDYEIIVISSEEIDKALDSPDMNLNLLEALHSAMITTKLCKRQKCDTLILDCPSNNTRKYIQQFRHFLKEDIAIKIIAEHKADVHYVPVSAASILAKVTRDRAIEDLKKKYKVDFGSGYPSDPRTVSFLQTNYNKYPFFRKSWETWREAAGIIKEKKKSTQRALGEY